MKKKKKKRDRNNYESGKKWQEAVPCYGVTKRCPIFNFSPAKNQRKSSIRGPKKIRYGDGAGAKKGWFTRT